MRPKMTLRIAIMLLLSLPNYSMAEPQAKAVYTSLISPRKFTQLPLSMDPDQARLEYGNLGGRWHTMAGFDVVPFGLKTPAITAALLAHGFIELYNFSRGYPVPWEAYRASFGFGAIFGSPLLNRHLPNGARLWLSVQVDHESDHAVNLSKFVETFTILNNAEMFDNGNASSYEYVKFTLWYSQPLPARMQLVLSLGARLFFFTNNDDRKLDGAVAGEIQFQRMFGSSLRLWSGFFAEAISNHFEVDERHPSYGNGYKEDLGGKPLVSFIGELGLDWRPTGNFAVAPYLRVADAHGRGLDFTARRSEFGAGLRLLY